MMTLKQLSIEIYLLIALCSLIGCGGSNSKTETTDSVTLKADSVKTETVSPEEITIEEEPEEILPPIDSSALASADFGYILSTVTADEREQTVTDSLTETVIQFEKEKYATIKVVTARPDMVVGGTIRQTQTWYYNAERQLCAYTSDYKSERAAETKLYLCRGEELTVIYIDYSFSDEGSDFNSYVRYASSSCPLCGVKITSSEEEHQISTISDYEYSSDFFNMHKDQIAEYKTVTELTKQGDRYSGLLLVNNGPEPDSISFSIDPNLVRKFFRKSIIQTENP